MSRNQFSTRPLFVILLLVLICLILIILINNQSVFEGAVFMNHQQCALHPLKRNLPYENFTITLSNGLCVHGWKLFPKTANANTDNVLIFTPGAGGMKSHSILYAEQLHVIYPEYEILLFDYPGHGASDGARTMHNCMDTLFAIARWTQTYTNRLWVTNCFGSIILFKTVEQSHENAALFLSSEQDHVVTINGMLHPFHHGIKPWPNWFVIGILNTVTRQSIYDSLNGRRGLDLLLQSNVLVNSIHWQQDPWVSVRHGDEFEKLVGCDHYMTYSGDATHYKLAMTDSRLVTFLQKC